MIAAHLLSQHLGAQKHIRPARPRRDLGAITELIAVGFADTLDAQGHMMLRDMRATARWGPVTWTLARWLGVIPALRGYVWEEDGRIVGNVSLTPAGYGRGWVIANVVVLPEYRRRGIARALMVRAMEDVAKRGAFAALQVLESNQAARALYRDLGFAEQRTFTRWRRPAYAKSDALPTVAHDVQRLRPRDGAALLALAERERPNARGGLGWLRPTRAKALQPPHWVTFAFGNGKLRAYWGIWGAAGTLDAALSVEHVVGSYTLYFDVLARPQQGEPRAELLGALLGFLAQRFAGRTLITEHPADDLAASEIWRAHQFHPERTLVHMIWRVPQKGTPKERV